MSKIIEVENLVEEYKKNERVLDNVSIAINAGEIFGLLEPNYNYKSENHILNILKNDKIKKCEANDVNFIINTQEVNFIDDIDLTSLLSNLLDNGIEVAKQSNDKVIELKIFKSCDMLLVNIKNTIKSKHHTINNRPISQKKYGHMGLGLYNVEEIVNKYNGFLKYEIDDQSFCIKIVFDDFN